MMPNFEQTTIKPAGSEIKEVGIEYLEQFYKLQQSVNLRHPNNPHRLLGIITEDMKMEDGLQVLFASSLMSGSELISTETIGDIVVAVASSPRPLA
ncbi:hypothetical protein KBC75_03930 [Candidatus Shapirobacteria bacterium]|nr:hypothetical protein [Candidatus Shapirobacteria bacterium]